MAFFDQNKARLCKNLIITLVFEKNANLFAKNWQKSQKIVIITSTPDWAIFCPMGDGLLSAVSRKFQKRNKFWDAFFSTVTVMH
jgi:hypothetical protein